MAKKQNSTVLNFVAWFTGVVVALAVGFGMIDGVLAIKWIPDVITIVVGWIVVLTTLLGAILAIVNK